MCSLLSINATLSSLFQPKRPWRSRGQQALGLFDLCSAALQRQPREHQNHCRPRPSSVNPMEISGTYFPSFLQDLQATFGIRGGCLVRKMPPQPGKKNVPNSTAEKTAVYYIKHFSSLQDLRIFFLVATSCHHLRHLRPSVRSILSTKPWPPWHLDKLWQGAVARQVRQCLDRPKATAPNVTCEHLQFRPLNEAPPTHLGSAPKRQEHPNVQRSSTCKVAQAFLLSLSLSL